MSDLEKLELEFEIVTLSHNLAKLKNSGLHAVEMQHRLEYCKAELEALKLKAECENHTESTHC